MNNVLNLTMMEKPSSKIKRRDRGSITKEEILQAALDILQKNGTRALSMRKIAEVMGCSVASPYAYFEKREDIFSDIIRMGEKSLTRDLAIAAEKGGDVFVRLENIAYAYWNFASENRELHKLMFNADSGNLYRRSLPALPTSYRVFLETIRAGIRSGEIRYPRKAYPSIARTMWAWMYGLIVLEMNDVLRTRRDSDPVKEGITFFQQWLGKTQ